MFSLNMPEIMPVTDKGIVSKLLHQQIHLILTRHLLIMAAPFNAQLDAKLSGLRKELPESFTRPFQINGSQAVAAAYKFALGAGKRFRSHHSLTIPFPPFPDVPGFANEPYPCVSPRVPPFPYATRYIRPPVLRPVQ